MTSLDFQKMLRDAKANKKAAEQRRDAEPVQVAEKRVAIPEHVFVEDDVLPWLSSDTSLRLDFSHANVAELPFTVASSVLSRVLYVPNFVSTQEEKLLLDRIDSPALQPAWHQLKKRRLQQWGGTPRKDFVAERVPAFLRILAQRLHSAGVFPEVPNHCLINEYEPGQGIMPHTDGPLYFPRVAIISMSGHTVFEFRPRLNEPPSLSLLVEPRSLLIFDGDAYTTYFHGISERIEDVLTREVVVPYGEAMLGETLERARRVSLTIRIVPEAKDRTL